jgi:toxin FitB
MLTIIDTDLWVEGERGNPAFLRWLRGVESVATTDVSRAEFLIGVHGVAERKVRERAAAYYREQVRACPVVEAEREDYETAGRLAGEARRTGAGKPGLGDALIGAIALRLGAEVATRNVKDFEALGVEAVNPLG